MSHLLDLFTPAEILHIIAVSNILSVLTTEDRKYLLAVRMGTPYSDGIYELEESEKDKFNSLFARFINGYPEKYICTKDPCPVCDRLKTLKLDFTGDGVSEEYRLVMNWMDTMSHVPEETGSPDTEAPGAFVYDDPAELGGEDSGEFPEEEDSAYEVHEKGRNGEETVSPGHSDSVQSLPKYPAHSVPDEQGLPLVGINENHPVVRDWQSIRSLDPVMMDEQDLRSYADVCHRIINSLSVLFPS